MCAVLDVLVVFPHFLEIIIVNDGSTDDTQKVAESYATKYKNLKVLKNSVNLGKTKTVIKGVEASRGDLIVLIDGDLIGLDEISIYKMIYFVIKGEFDMTILDRGGDRMAVTGFFQSWTARLNGGERAFWKSEFKKIKFPIRSRYGIEQILNLHYVKKGLKARTIYCPKLMCTYQIKKKGVIRGMLTYTKMFIECYRTSKVKGYYLQVRDVVEDRIEPLYKIYNRTKHKKTIMSAIAISGLILSIYTFLNLYSERAVKIGKKEIKNPFKKYDL